MGKKIEITVTVDSDQLAGALESFLKLQASEDTELVAAKRPPASNKKAQAQFDEADEEEETETTVAEAKVDDEEDEDIQADEEEDEDDFTEPKKAAKATTAAPAPAKKANGAAKKVTVEDVNDAAKAKVRAWIDKGLGAAEARARVLKVLTSKFKVKSVNALKSEQYSAVIQALA